MKSIAHNICQHVPCAGLQYIVFYIIYYYIIILYDGRNQFYSASSIYYNDLFPEIEQYITTHTHHILIYIYIMLCAYIPATLYIYYYCITWFETFRTLFLYYTIIIYRTVAAATSQYKQLYSVCFYNKPFSVGRIRIVFIKHYEAVAVKLERPPPPPPRLMWSRPSERTVRFYGCTRPTSPIYIYVGIA